MNFGYKAMTDFVLSHWRAWSPELNIEGCSLLETASISELPAVPKLMQRRLSPLAKAVLKVAEACQAQGSQIPIVFSSAHGEICKSLEMLKVLQSGQELSPTGFSLSVHNAIAGLFSIAFHNFEEITVIAPCREGIAAAFVEGLGMLREGAQEVLLILYDEPIADFYPVAPYKLNSTYPCVLGLRIGLNVQGLPLTLSRSIQKREDGEQPVQLLAFIRFLLTGQAELKLGNEGHCWTWRKQS